MRSYLPRILQHWPGWQYASLNAAKFAGAKTCQLAAGLALGFAGLAVADTVTDSPGLHALVAVAFVIIAALAGWSAWVAHSARRRRHLNPSSISQAHNLWNRALNRRFRRG